MCKNKICAPLQSVACLSVFIDSSIFLACLNDASRTLTPHPFLYENRGPFPCAGLPLPEIPLTLGSFRPAYHDLMYKSVWFDDLPLKRKCAVH